MDELAESLTPSDDYAAGLELCRHLWMDHVALHGNDLRALLDGVPGEFWDHDPWLVAAYASSWRSVGSPSRSAALPYFDAAQSMITEQTAQHTRATIAVQHSAALRSVGRLDEALAALAHAVDLIADDDAKGLGWRIHVRAKIALHRGITLLHLGRLDDARADLRTALGLTHTFTAAERVECHGALAVMEHVLGEFDAARAHTVEARSASDDSGLLDSQFGAGALVAELLIAVDQHRLDDAEALAPQVAAASRRTEWEPAGTRARAAVALMDDQFVSGLDLLRQAVQIFDRWRPAGMIASATDTLRAALLLRLGQTADAWSILSTVEPMEHHAVCPGRLIAHLLILRGDDRGAIAALQQCEALGDSHSCRNLADVYLLLAAAHLRLGDPQLADVAFDRGALLAARNRLQVPFRMVPPTLMTALLARAARRQQPFEVRTLLDEITSRGDHSAVRDEPLSEREREVTRALMRELTLAEIAEELFISANTVKSHVKNVYRKLGVSTRPAAIMRARELGERL